MSTGVILTRSARRKAGLPPPSPLHPGQKKIKQRTQDTGKETTIEVKDVDSCHGNHHQTEFIWVQCDSCKQWRKIDKRMEAQLEEMWYCHMNTDLSYQSCDLAEEEWQFPDSGWIYTYQGLVLGQLVWAKMNGYPPWPGVISPDPWCSNTFVSKEDVGLLYHVEFLGKSRSHLWLPEEMVEPYRDSCSLGEKSCPKLDLKHVKKLQYAISQADELVRLSSEERLAVCEYTAENKERLDKVRVKRQDKPSISSVKTDQPPVSKPSSLLLNNVPLSQSAVAMLELLNSVPKLNGLLLCKVPDSLKPAVNSQQVKSSVPPPKRTVSQLMGKNYVPPSNTVTRCPQQNGMLQKRMKPCRGRAKKKKPSLVQSQSILQYFEPRSQDNGKDLGDTLIDLVPNDQSKVSVSDHVIPESLDALEEDAQNDMLEIEDMLSHFDDTGSGDKRSVVDHSDFVEEEILQIEELLASFQK